MEKTPTDTKDDTPVTHYKKLPWGIWLLERLKLCPLHRSLSYKVLVFTLTFCAYTSYHLTRKPFSVVKISLCPVCANCSYEVADDGNRTANVTPGWAPFNDENRGGTLLGAVDYSWLFTYALALYFSGYIADRLNLRYLLTFGMLGSGLSVILLGIAYFANIHQLAYFILVQVFGGIMQSTGWPGVVAVMSHWFGKTNRGLIMGIWNSHTSVGNILGTIIPSFWAECGSGSEWGWSFILPGAIIVVFGCVLFLFLVTDPAHVGLPPPVHHLDEDLRDLRKSPRLPSLPLPPPTPPSTTVHTSLDEDKEHHTDHVDGLLDCPEGEGKEGDRKELCPNGVKERKPIAPESHKQILQDKPKAINFFRALLIPGVVEYAIALFFNKLVSYTFLFWLPLYVKLTHSNLSGPQSDWVSTLFDVGGIIGGIIAGVVSDLLNARAVTCSSMLVLAVPSLFILRSTGDANVGVFIVLLILNGVLINGPYAIITTAVSSDLGTHPSLKSNTNAKATVTAIIDGTGSLGAAFGPLLVGLITDFSTWNTVFYFLMVSCLISALMLSRLFVKETIQIVRKGKNLFFKLKYGWRVNSGAPDTVELRHLRAHSDSEHSQSASDNEHVFQKNHKL